MKRHSYKDGEVIFHENDPSDTAFLIIDGKVEILHGRKHDGDATMAVLGRGDYFGEMGVIDDKPRSATARAKGETACMSVTKEEFMDMLLNRPQESIELLKVLFERLRKANDRLALLEKAGHPPR
jgi:CRP-like cAMP-binding protein